MNINDRYTDINGRVRVITGVGAEVEYRYETGSSRLTQSAEQFKADTVAKLVHEETSPEVASVAGKLLQDPETPAEVRKVAASALTQAEPSMLQSAMKHLSKKHKR